MGQYFVALCNELGEVLSPETAGAWSKQREFISSPIFCKMFVYLNTWSSSLGNGGDIRVYDGSKPIHMGRWYGKRTKIVGDYDKSGDFKKSAHYIEIGRNIVLEMGACGLFTSDELQTLIETYTGPENKDYRQKLHIFKGYALKMERSL